MRSGIELSQYLRIVFPTFVRATKEMRRQISGTDIIDVHVLIGQENNNDSTQSNIQEVGCIPAGEGILNQIQKSKTYRIPTNNDNTSKPSQKHRHGMVGNKYISISE